MKNEMEKKLAIVNEHIAVLGAGGEGNGVDEFLNHSASALLPGEDLKERKKKEKDEHDKGVADAKELVNKMAAEKAEAKKKEKERRRKEQERVRREIEHIEEEKQRKEEEKKEEAERKKREIEEKIEKQKEERRKRKEEMKENTRKISK